MKKYNQMDKRKKRNKFKVNRLETKSKNLKIRELQMSLSKVK